MACIIFLLDGAVLGAFYLNGYGCFPHSLPCSPVEIFLSFLWDILNVPHPNWIQLVNCQLFLGSNVSLSGPSLEVVVGKLIGISPKNIVSFLSGLETHREPKTGQCATCRARTVPWERGSCPWHLPQRLHHLRLNEVPPGHTHYICTSVAKGGLSSVPLRLWGNPPSQLKVQQSLHFYEAPLNLSSGSYFSWPTCWTLKQGLVSGARSEWCLEYRQACCYNAGSEKGILLFQSPRLAALDVLVHSFHSRGAFKKSH